MVQQEVRSTEGPLEAEGPLLCVEGLCKSYGGLRALDHLSFTVMAGEILGLIGPNGAGKTTAFNLISGADQPDLGRIRFRNRSIGGWPPHRIVSAGIARTFQDPRPFMDKTIAKNIEVSLIPNALFSRDSARRERRQLIDETCERTGLCHAWNGRASHNGAADDRCHCWSDYPASLPHAGLRRLEVAKALATDPELLLLDEPFAGLTMGEASELSELLRSLRDEGRTLIVVDHNMQALMRLVDRVLVIHFGRKIAAGTPDLVASDPLVQQAYLSGSAFFDELTHA